MVQLSTPWGDPNRGMGPPWGAFCQITLTSCLFLLCTIFSYTCTLPTIPVLVLLILQQWVASCHGHPPFLAAFSIYFLFMFIYVALKRNLRQFRWHVLIRFIGNSVGAKGNMELTPWYFSWLRVSHIRIAVAASDVRPLYIQLYSPSHGGLHLIT